MSGHWLVNSCIDAVHCRQKFSAVIFTFCVSRMFLKLLVSELLLFLQAFAVIPDALIQLTILT